MGSMRMGLALAVAAAPLAWGAVSDGNDCGGFTAAEAAAWLKVAPAQVTREVAKSGDKWVCAFAVGRNPAIAFSMNVSSSARRATADLERYRDDLAAQGDSASWKGKLPNGVYSDMFGAGDEAVWTDINGMLTVRRENVTMQFTLPKGKEAQLSLGKEVAAGF
jgi:hypothetical protein